MNITTTSIYRILAEMGLKGCTCRVMREFEDASNQKPLGDAVFTPCDKHRDQPGVDILELVLTDAVEERAKQAPTSGPRPGAAAVVNADGSLEQRTPIVAKQIGKTVVQPSGSSVRPGGIPVNSAQTARTGMKRTFVRPTESVKPGRTPAPVAIDDGPEDDILAQNDPEDNSR